MKKIVMLLAGLLVFGGLGATVLVARDVDNPIHWSSLDDCDGTSGTCMTNKVPTNP